MNNDQVSAGPNKCGLREHCGALRSGALEELRGAQMERAGGAGSRLLYGGSQRPEEWDLK